MPKRCAESVKCNNIHHFADSAAGRINAFFFLIYHTLVLWSISIAVLVALVKEVVTKALTSKHENKIGKI